MKKNFNEAINDFIAWNLRKTSGDVSEEEFNSLLEKRKEATISSIETFKKRIENIPYDNNNSYVPIVLLIMMFSSFGSLNQMVESFIGKKLSSEEVKEYVDLSADKMNIDKVIELLKCEEINESIVPPVVKSLFSLKKLILPYFEGLKSELQIKFEKYENNRTVSKR